jgi:aminoglycoside 3-N-acetyltransferase
MHRRNPLLTAPRANPKALAKHVLRSVRRRWIHGFHSFGVDDLERALRGIGVRAADVVLMHSSFDAFEGFRGKPTEVIAVLQRILTSSGTLLMPTMPFSGTAVAFAATDPLFDSRRTPSRMGLLTELFRRMPEVVRSRHPTHSAAAWGARAADMTASHENATTPCGPGSPYHRLLEVDGKVLLLGTDISALTFFHALEDVLEKQLPVQPFTSSTFRLRTQMPDGSIATVTTRLYEPAVSKRRNIFKLVPYLRSRGAWHATRVGRMTAVLLSAREILAAAQDMLAKREFCYD